MLRFHRRPLRRLVAALSVTAAAVSACRPVGSSLGALDPVYDTTTGELTLLRHDANQNGVAETRTHLRGTRILQIDVDTDEDGRIDRWEHYDADQRLQRVGFSRAHDGREDAWSFADASGVITRIESLAPGTSRVTRTEYYDQATLVRAEEDSDADGAVDRWERYDRGRLVSLAFDTAHRGAPTTTLTYQPDGSAQIETLKPDVALRR